MSERFLSEEELVTLTGRKFPAKQIEALRRMGIQFYVNARNRPVVIAAALLLNGTNVSAAQTKLSGAPEPDRHALIQAFGGPR